MVVWVGETLVEPLLLPPVLKFVPVQPVASVEFHVRVVEPPRLIEVGFAEMVAVGADGLATVTVITAEVAEFPEESVATALRV